MLFLKYIECLKQVLGRIEAQPRAIADAASLIASSLSAGGIVHIFGAGHSHMIAEEAFYRAGGIAAVNPILDPRLIFLKGVLDSTAAEREPGYADSLLKRERTEPRDTMIVVSNSGRNASPVEMAMGAKRDGLAVIAITNLDQSRSAPSRHASGLRLFEIADVSIDNGVPPGDASIMIPGAAAPMGPASTVAGAAIVHSLMLEAAAALLARGKAVAVLPSANVGEGSEAALRAALAPYRSRIRLIDA